MKKIISLLLAFVLVLSFTGCVKTSDKESGNTESKIADNQKSNSGDESTEPKFDTAGLALPISKDKIEIEYMISEHANNPVKEDWIVFKELEKVTNIKLKLQPVGADYGQKLNLMVSSGQLPELFTSNTDFGKMYGVEGALIPISDYLKKMPNYSKFLAENPQTKKDLAASDSKIYNAVHYGHEVFGQGWLYRMDILKKHNLNVPKTYDEFYEVCKKLKEIYPDSYPFSHRKKNSITAEIGVQWGTGYGVYYNFDTKKFQYGSTEDNFRDMLMFLKKLYDEGLMDQEWATLSAKQWEDRMTNEQSFITYDYLARIKVFNPAMAEKNPEYNIEAVLPPKAPNGKALITTTYDKNGTAMEGFMVSKNNKHPEETFKLLDFLYSRYGQIITNLGVEGVTYKKEANGNLVWVDDIKSSISPNGTKHYTNDFGFIALGTYTVVTPEVRMLTREKGYKEAVELYENNDIATGSNPQISMTESELDVVKNKTSLADFVDEQIMKFVLGERDFSEWDAYVKEVKDKGVDDLVKVYNDALDRYNKIN